MKSIYSRQLITTLQVPVKSTNFQSMLSAVDSTHVCLYASVDLVQLQVVSIIF
jgi:hypothetical protein